MSTWAEFEADAPDLAAAGRGLIYRTGEGEAILATVRGGDAPRIYPVNVGIVGGRLYVFVIAGSPKRTDLETDGRFALHALVDPNAPSEFLVRGWARPVDDEETWSSAASEWPFSVDASYRLFELTMARVLYGDRATADEWPPPYTSWRGKGLAGRG